MQSLTLDFVTGAVLSVFLLIALISSLQAWDQIKAYVGISLGVSLAAALFTFLVFVAVCLFLLLFLFSKKQEQNNSLERKFWNIPKDFVTSELIPNSFQTKNHLENKHIRFIAKIPRGSVPEELKRYQNQR